MPKACDASASIIAESMKAWQEHERALEGSRILALKAIGYSAPVGLTFGVAIRVAQISWACFGLVIYALFTTQKT
jgi:hypothetical protein